MYSVTSKGFWLRNVEKEFLTIKLQLAPSRYLNAIYESFVLAGNSALSGDRLISPKFGSLQ